MEHILGALVLFALIYAGPSFKVASATHHARKVCENVFCGAGRECAVVDYDTPTCVCQRECPKHDHPVCANDNITYPNFCEMHRAACLKGIKLYRKHNGSCLVETQVPTDGADKPQKPLVCFEIERDELRQLLMDWMKGQVVSGGWMKKGKSYKEAVEEKFVSCDTDRNNKIDTREFITCIVKNDSAVLERGGREHIIRGLCVDALIVIADKNNDWSLDLFEFFTCLDPDFVPPKKQCSLEDNRYEDGAEVSMACNKCLCACGNWVCTAIICNNKQEKTLVINNKGDLPDKEERRKLLSGFKASDAVKAAQDKKRKGEEERKKEEARLFGGIIRDPEH